MKRAVDNCDKGCDCDTAAAKRIRAQPGTIDVEECTSASPAQRVHVVAGNKGLVAAAGAAAAMESVLERTLSDADAALHLTLHAMMLASQIYEHGTADAADRALNIAEQALAATVQQLAKAQALVVNKVQQQVALNLHAARHDEEEDAELQDTCSSSFSS